MQVRVTAQSQPHRLRERLEEVAVSHGAELRADLRNVRVTALAGAPDGVVFFCNMEPVSVREALAPGDGRPLPQGVQLGGLQVPGSGVYDILNAYISSNGELRVLIDGASQVRAVVRAEVARSAPAPFAIPV